MPAVSIYLRDETLARLDGLVRERAGRDRAAGRTGRDVASRSSVIDELVAGACEGSALSLESITYAVVSLAEEYGAEAVSLFGSHARGDATEVSDVDILLEKGSIRGMQVLDFQEDLSRRLDRKVDVVTTAGVSERFMSRIAPDCIEIYRAEGKRA